MTKTRQIDTLIAARNALLAAVRVVRYATTDDHQIDLLTNEAIGLIAQVREARGLDDE
jgi:hypothetical protein